MLLKLLLAIIAINANTLDVFKVDLDSPPETRWAEVITSKKQEILSLTTFIKNSVNPMIIKYISSAVLAGKTFDSEIIKEFKGAANILNVDFNLILVGNFINEFYSMCSSFIIRKTSGQILLGRNLDYFLNNKIRELSVQVDFYKSGNLLYRTMTFAGYFGVLTGLRPGSFGISLNARSLLDYSVIWESLAVLEGSKASAFAIRHALETYESYEDALEYLKTVPIISGEYFCIAGITSGAVITRSRNYVTDLIELDETRWFIVQTNYDHWLPQPAHDDRYSPATENIVKKGQESIDEKALLELLSTPPSFNFQTLYTTVLNPGTGYWDTVKWSN
jgi:beta subunit of N-acylethanolamine-hydrolyzing acid amidase/Linear amide C-N hydrolases, choloylglycine hydrolase family